MKRIVIAALALSLGSFVAGCSSGSSCAADCSSVTTGAAGSGGSGGSTGTGGAAGSGSSTDSGGGADIRTGTCTEPGSVCIKLKFPAATEAPTRLIGGFYLAAPPPAAPPDKVGDQYDFPKITPGAESAMKMVSVNLDGDYYFYAALYMPGGGQFVPKGGIDYEAYTTEKFTLAKGAPFTLPATLEFKLAPVKLGE